MAIADETASRSSNADSSLINLSQIDVGSLQRLGSPRHPVFIYDTHLDPRFKRIKEYLGQQADMISRDTSLVIKGALSSGSPLEKAQAINQRLNWVSWPDGYIKGMGDYLKRVSTYLKSKYGSADIFLHLLPSWLIDSLSAGTSLESAVLVFSNSLARGTQYVTTSKEGFSPGHWYLDMANPFRYDFTLSPTLQAKEERQLIQEIAGGLRKLGIPIPDDISYRYTGNSGKSAGVVLDECTEDHLVVELNSQMIYPQQYLLALLVEEIVEAHLYTKIPREQLHHVVKEILSHLGVAALLTDKSLQENFGLTPQEAETVNENYLLFQARQHLYNLNSVYFEIEIWRHLMFWKNISYETVSGIWNYTRARTMGIVEGTTKDMGFRLPYFFYRPYVVFSPLAYLWADALAATANMEEEWIDREFARVYRHYLSNKQIPDELYQLVNPRSLVEFLDYSRGLTYKHIRIKNPNPKADK